MRTLILGAGGIGGYFGGRLAEAGADVTFLVRDRRAERMKADGLVIESPVGDARIDVATTTAGQLGGACDLVLLSCKAYDLDSAIEAIRPAIGPATTILPLLNGLAHVDRLSEAFGAERVLGGLAHISVTMADDGRIRHLNKLHMLTYGPRHPAQASRCDAVEALLAKTSFQTKRTEEVMQDMWEKFAFITAAAAMGCLMRADVAAIMSADDGERLTLKMLGECEAVAEASGFRVRDKARKWSHPFLTERGSDFMPSMLRDLENGAKVEADHLPGDMIRRGAALGVPTDMLRVAYCHLQAYQGRREA